MTARSHSPRSVRPGSGDAISATARSIRATRRQRRPSGTAVSRALAGVVAVWSAADLPEITKPIGTASTGRPFAQPVLVPDIARYAGEPVAVVIAESAYRVADALELIEVEYDPLPPIATLEEAA